MKTALLVTVGLLTAAAPAEAQLWSFPDYATPSAAGTPQTFVSADYGRGLNDSSGKLNSFGAVVGRTGLGQRFTAMAGVGMIDGAESQWTFGGAVGANLLDATSTAQVSVQGGIGYTSVDVLGETLSSVRIPIGVALKTRVEGQSANLTPWVMPRLNIVRASLAGSSDTTTDFGASAGVAVTTPRGVGFHAALDLLAADNSIWQFGVGAHYVLPN